MDTTPKLKRFDLCIQVGIFPSGASFRKDSPPDLIGSAHSCTVFAVDHEQALALLKPYMDTHRVAAPSELAPAWATSRDIAEAEGSLGNGPQLSLEAAERAAVRRALMHSGGNKRLAARLLGCGKTTLYRKMRDFDLEGVS